MDEVQQQILNKLDSLGDKLSDFEVHTERRFGEINVELTKLKARSRWWGTTWGLGGAGAITAALEVLRAVFSGK